MLDSVFIQLLIVKIRHFLLFFRNIYFRKVYKMNIGKDVRISLKANLDKRNPRGIFIGDGTYLAFGSTILCHDMARNYKADVKIGKNCFIGANSIILPGVNLGDEVVVAAGSVVTKNVESNTIVAGNPAHPIKTGIRTIKWGRIISELPN